MRTRCGTQGLPRVCSFFPVPFLLPLLGVGLVGLPGPQTLTAQTLATTSPIQMRAGAVFESYQFQEADRIQTVVSYSFRQGRTGAGVVYGGFFHRSEGTALLDAGPVWTDRGAGGK